MLQSPLAWRPSLSSRSGTKDRPTALLSSHTLTQMADGSMDGWDPSHLILTTADLVATNLLTDGGQWHSLSLEAGVGGRPLSQ